MYFNQYRLKTALTELDRINKQLEKFVYIVSHDLKSPLSSVVMMLELIKSEPYIKANEEVKENIDMIYQASCRLSDMIMALLEYSATSLSQQTVEEVDVHQMVQHLSALLFPPKHIQIQLLNKLPVLVTKKVKLEQVFQNLLSNAIKYNDKPQGLIQIGYTEKNNLHEFFVKDNGPGIAEEDKNRIFKLFETTSNQSQRDSSTGIGLNLLKIIVEEQGGKIWVESKEGEGSVFYFQWMK